MTTKNIFIPFLFCFLMLADYAAAEKVQPVIGSISPATYAPNEVIIKLKTDASPDTNSPFLKSIEKRYPVRTIKPVFKKLRDKISSTGKTESQITLQSRNAFPLRTKRSFPVLKDFGLRKIYIIRFENNIDVYEVIRELQKSPDIEYAEPNFIFSLRFQPTDEFFNTSGYWGQDYQDLWGLHRIDMEGAWDITQGNPSVTIAVIDTGVDYTNPELGGCFGPTCKVVDGYDFVNNDPDPMDDLGHGTHVAGTIAANPNNYKMPGVSWNAKILAVKVLPRTGSANIADIVDGIYYAVDHGADVTNMSFGGSYGQTFSDVISYARSQGVIQIAAAGNTGNPILPEDSSNLPEVITVAAWNPYNQWASFSSYGPAVDITAPGDHIFSTKPSGENALSGCVSLNMHTYMVCSGTSMAAPHVTGVATLILSLRPELSPASVQDILQQSAEDVLNPGYDQFTGYGLLNAQAALHLAQTYAPPIQRLIDEAHNGDTVLVSPGIYRETIDFHGKNIILRSANGPASTVIDGQGAGAVVRFQNGENSGAVLDGFTVINGSQGGIDINAASPTLRNNIITQNTYALPNAGYAGGIIIRNGNPLIEDNTVTLNSNWDGPGTGGITVLGTSHPTIINNIISDNSVTFSDHMNAGAAGGISVAQGANAMISGNTISRNSNLGGSGGGVSCLQNASCTVTDNIIEHNSSSSYGGIYVDHATAEIASNAIAHNSSQTGASGVHVSYSENIILAGNTISSNTSTVWGGAIKLYNTSAVIEENTISDNVTALRGGGINAEYAMLIIKNNRIIGNKALDYSTLSGVGGGISLYLSNASIEKNILARNEADIGSALYSSSSTVNFINNTVTQNTTNGSGQGTIYASGSSNNLNIMNSILWANDGISDPEINEAGGMVSVNFTVLQWDPFREGAGNLSSDPLFSDPSHDDFRLSYGSPCIDAGNPEPQYNDSDGSRNDIGAIGNNHPAQTIRYVPQNYPTIQSAIDEALNNDEIIISAGTYQENLVIQNKALTIKGAGKSHETVIDGNQAGSVIQIQGVSQEHGVRLENLTVQNGKRPLGAGIFCSNARMFVKNSRILHNNGTDLSTGGTGMYLDTCSGEVTNSLIAQNVMAGGYGGGIYLYHGSHLDIVNSTIAHNNASLQFNGAGGGIALHGSTIKATNSILWDNYATYNQPGFGGNDLAIVYSIPGFSYADMADLNYTDIEGGWPASWGTGNMEQNPVFENPGSDNYHVRYEGPFAPSPCINAGNPALAFNDPNDSRNDMGTYGGPGSEWHYISPPPPDFTCLLGGTSILMADGSQKNIEDVVTGDMVLSFTAQGELVKEKVSNTFVHPERQGYLVVETPAGPSLRITKEHPVASGGAYTPIGDLTLESPLTYLKNGSLTETKITGIKEINSSQTVYNLEVENSHTYFADGYLVHNKIKGARKIIPQF